MKLRIARIAESRTRPYAVAVWRVAVVGLLVLWTTGFSRPPSRTLEFPQHFELTARENRDETFYDAPKDSTVTRRFASSLTFCGRIEGIVKPVHTAREDRKTDGRDSLFSVHADSLLFRSDAPFPFTALLRRDTVAVMSIDRGPVTRAGGLDVDREMLECIFEGPALVVGVPEKNGPADVKDEKAHCQGGLYRRLNLPVTLGAFLLAIPSDRGDAAEWAVTSWICPSFSGLGQLPHLNLTCRVIDAKGAEGGTFGVEIACDTTLSNVRGVTPAGQAVDIISDRIRVRGTLRTWPGVPLLCTGELEIEENIRYSRPDLESPVLEKRCRVEILLEPR